MESEMNQFMDKETMKNVTMCQKCLAENPASYRLVEQLLERIENMYQVNKAWKTAVKDLVPKKSWFERIFG